MEDVPRTVSMKSGLEGRNNPRLSSRSVAPHVCLNEVRPRRPEQLETPVQGLVDRPPVSMKSGLEGRNNDVTAITGALTDRLNEVRPRRPEQSALCEQLDVSEAEFVSMKSGLEGRNNW